MTLEQPKEAPMPIRIQRKRTKGWKMPENTVYVGRGSKYGNPHHINALTTREMAINGYIYSNSHPMQVEIIRKDLRGKNLACWCKLNELCHADWLLEIANKGDSNG